MHRVTRTIFPVFAFKVTHRVILLTRFCKLLTRVATLSGGTCLKCINGTTPLCAIVDVDVDVDIIIFRPLAQSFKHCTKQGMTATASNRRNHSKRG